MHKHSDLQLDTQQFQKTLIFINLPFSTIQFLPMHLVVWVHVHSYGLYLAFMNTTVEPLLPSTTLNSDL